MNPPEPLVAVVDDEAAVRKAMSRLLRSAGLDVETYASGAAFIDAVHERRPLCVVLDLHMPGMDGFDVHQYLHENAIAMPVILITGHDTPETRDRAIDAGMTAHFRKPVDDQALLEVVAHCIVQSQAGSESDPPRQPDRQRNSR